MSTILKIIIYLDYLLSMKQFYLELYIFTIHIYNTEINNMKIV